MNQDERKKAHEQRKQLYYSLENDLWRIEIKLSNLKKNRGQTPAFKNLMIAVEMMREQIRRDYLRYENRINAANAKDQVSEMQKALNRERAKREELEKQVKEATESSGLFIKYARKALGI